MARRGLGTGDEPGESVGHDNQSPQLGSQVVSTHGHGSSLSLSLEQQQQHQQQ